MATYKEIQEWVSTRYGFVPKTCWIAHVKEIAGLPLTKAANRLGKDRVYPCPSDKVQPIMEAFRQLGVIK